MWSSFELQESDRLCDLKTYGKTWKYGAQVCSLTVLWLQVLLADESSEICSSLFNLLFDLMFVVTFCYGLQWIS